jgi:DNA-binding transcriptional MerR regulator
MKPFTIRALAKKVGLSRSTLLYYDRMGLLSPSGRSEAGYRLYSEADVARLERLMLYRDAGLPLEKIRQLLDAGEDRGREALTGRLAQINDEIQALREQQRVIVRLLGDVTLARGARALNKETWIALLQATGLSEADMDRWHREFERRAPEAHHDFLESLGIPRDEIALIRQWSRSDRSQQE